MSITHFQKKFIKDNIRKLPFSEISAHINISEKEILAYLKDQWREEKYKRFVNDLKKQPQSKNQNAKEINLDSNILNKKTNCIVFGLLAVLVLIVYANSLNNDFLSDDLPGIVNNKIIGTFKDVVSQPFAFIRPFFYFIAYNLGGKNPIFFRSINVLLHIGSVWLLYLVLQKITKKQLAIFASIIFAVHPILAESVAWISGGGYVQYSFFFLLSLYTYILSSGNMKYYIISILAFTASLLSSPTAVTLPLIYLIYEISFGNWRKNWVKAIPFFIIGGAIFYVFFAGIGTRLEIQKTTYYQINQGSEGFFGYIKQVIVALTSYLGLLFWPHMLTLYHSEMVFSVFNFIIRTLAVFLFFGALVYSFFRNKFIFFCLSLFFISLIPTLNPYGISSLVAERYAYLASVGIIVVFSYILYKLSTVNEPWKKTVNVLFILIVIALGIRTIYRNIDWRSEDNLWISSAKTSPSSPNNHNNLGDVYYRHGDYKKALEEFKFAINLKPNYGDAYNNLGNTYLALKDIDNALLSYQQALKLNPNLWPSMQSIGTVYFYKKDYAKAIEYFKKATAVPTASFQPSFNLGAIYAGLGNEDEGKKWLLKALELDPTNEKIKQAISTLSAK